MNIDSAFPSKYLKASDIGENQPVVTIDRIAVEPVGRDQEMKPIVYFVGKTKGIVLNKTNAKLISNIAKSEDTDDWTGIKVRLIATEVEFQGDLVMSLRVREIKKATKAAPEGAASTEAPDESEIPF